VITTHHGVVFDKEELERDPTLKRIQAWGFPICHLAERYKRSVLSRLAYTIFKEADLFHIFRLSPVKFFNFFHSLECGYWNIPCEWGLRCIVCQAQYHLRIIQTTTGCTRPTFSTASTISQPTLSEPTSAILTRQLKHPSSSLHWRWNPAPCP